MSVLLSLGAGRGSSSRQEYIIDERIGSRHCTKSEEPFVLTCAGLGLSVCTGDDLMGKAYMAGMAISVEGVQRSSGSNEDAEND